MQIRIKAALVQLGNIHVTRGEVLDLPEALAKTFIADGHAVAVPKAEQAIVPHIPHHAHGGRIHIARAPEAAFPPAAAKASKSKGKK